MSVCREAANALLSYHTHSHSLTHSSLSGTAELWTRRLHGRAGEEEALGLIATKGGGEKREQPVTCGIPVDRLTMCEE